MEQKAKYWLTLTFIFMGFSYTADGYQMAAIVFSCFAVVVAIDAHSIHTLRRHCKDILLYGTIVSLCTFLFGLTTVMPMIWFVAFCNVACCILFEESSRRTVRHTVEWMRVVMVMLYALTVILPFSTYGQTNTILLITFAFLPMQITYCYQVFVAQKRIIIASKPQVY